MNFSRRSAAVLLGLLFLGTGAFAAPTPSALALVTILDGEATLIRDNAKFTLTEGVKLQADDLLELGDKGRLLRIEYPDGTSLSFGPGTRALLAPKLAGERGRARAYLLRGWAKLTVAPKGAPASLTTPLLDATVATNAVIAVLPEATQVFAETGEVNVTRPATSLKSGEWLAFAPQLNNKPQVAPRPSAAFLQQVPRSFLDALPSRAALFAGKEREPKRAGDMTYADAQPWLDASEPALRRLALTRWQPLARNPDFRRGLLADMKAHAEWQPVLFPPAPASAPSAPRY